MSIVTLRPNGLYGYTGVWYNNYSYGPDPHYWDVADANDGTSNYDVSDGAVAEYNLQDYSLAANERCWHARAVVRTQGNSPTFQFNEDYWLRLPFGDGGGGNINGVVNGWSNFTGGWYGGELSQSDINAMRLLVRDNGGVTRPIWADVWAEIEILHQPTVSNVQPTGTITNRSPSVSWTYTDPDGRIGQQSWRLHIRRADTLELIYDSGENVNSAGSMNLPVALGNGTYQFIVQVSNGNWGAWYSNWTYASPNVTINATPATPTAVSRTGDPTDTTPNFSANLTGYTGYQVQTKARYEIWNADASFNPTTLVGTVDSSYITGAGAATAEYASALPIGRYVVRAMAIETGGQSSGWSSYTSFQVLQAANKDLNAIWDVAASTIAVSKDFTALWNTNVNNQKELTALWNTYLGVSKDLTMYWNVALTWIHVNDDSGGTTWTGVLEG